MSDKRINFQYQWNLSVFFKNDEDPSIGKQQKLVYEKSYEFINKWNPKKRSGYRDDYLKDPEILAIALKEFEEWETNYGVDGSVGYYFWLKSMLDQNNPEIKARINKITEVAQKIENDIQFFLIRISRIDPKLQPKFLKAKSLQKYHHFLENLFKESKHLLTEDQEKIMNLKGKVSHHNWVQMTAGFISKEERTVLNEDSKKELKNFNEILALVDNPNKKIRDTAAKAVNDIFNKWIDVAENELNSVYESKKVNDDLRNYSRPDESRHLSDDIDTEVVDALREAVSKRFDTARKYYKLKARLLGLKQLEYHERNIPYGKIDKKYKFDESKNLVSTVFNKLDPIFTGIFEGFLNDGRVDVYPKKGKYSGAFCTQGSKSLPIFILLNHNERLNDVLTLAHEMGHGIHHTLMKEQNALNVGAPMSTAEVASTFMEDFVLQELMKEADDELKLSLMMMKLNDDISTIYRQIAIYDFEFELHTTFRTQGYLSKEEIGKIFQKNMAAYMGDSVEQSEGSQNWWIYISHIRSFFYVYSYASGLLISKSLQNAVKEEPAFIQKVIGFFKAGSSESPKNTFLKLGVDISDKSFWNKGLNEVEDLLKETEALAKKLKRI